MAQKINLGKVGLTPRGEYDEGTPYVRLDFVQYQGSSYVALEAVTGEAPDASEKWAYLAEKGEKGDVPVFSVSAETTEPGTEAEVEQTGGNENPNLHFKIPIGNDGAPGKTGATPNITFSAKTGLPGSEASVEQGGTPEEPTVTITVPRGDQGAAYLIKGPAYESLEALQAAVQDAQVGDQYNVGTEAPYSIYRWTGSAWEDQGKLQGPPGEDGKDGAPGTNGENGATFTPSVDEAGNLSWTNDKELPNPGTVNIKGKDGRDGTDATVTRSDAAPQPLAAQASAGDSEEVSRANHVHKLPTAAEVGAFGKGETIPVDHGGTGATTAGAALKNLGLAFSIDEEGVLNITVPEELVTRPAGLLS